MAKTKQLKLIEIETREDALKYCANLYDWLSKHPHANKVDWPGWEKVKMVINECFCCHYVNLQTVNFMNNTCAKGLNELALSHCPLKLLWPQGCCQQGSPFDIWSKYSDQRGCDAAKRIADACREELAKPPAQRCKKILYLRLTKEWFDKIARGEKTIEFRRCTGYWGVRLVNPHYVVCPKCKCISTQTVGSACIRDHKGCDGIMETYYRQFDEIYFRNGYGSRAPFMRVEFKGISIIEDPAVLPLGYQRAYGIALGRVLEILNWEGNHSDLFPVR